MLGTDTAGNPYCFAQRFARSMDTDTSIVLGDASTRRQIAQAAILQIDKLNRFAILRLQLD